MRIYRRAEFLMLPSGVIFAKGARWHWQNISRKGDTLFDHEGKADDFCYRDLFNIESNDSGEWADRLEEMLESGASYPLDMDEGRDGYFDNDDLFFVLEAPDLFHLVEVLTSAMEVSGMPPKRTP